MLSRVADIKYGALAEVKDAHNCYLTNNKLPRLSLFLPTGWPTLNTVPWPRWRTL